MTETMRGLSFRAAQSCEHATGPVCKCRCGGAFHGKARVDDTRTLPLDDPHSPSQLCPRCKGTKVISWWSREGDTTLECPKCKGTGRFMTPKTQKQTIPPTVIVVD